MPSHLQPEGLVHISDITLTLRQHFGKTVDQVVFGINARQLRKIPVTISPGNQHKELFDPILILPMQDRLFITMHYQKRRWLGIPARSKTVAVELSEVNDEAQDDQYGRKLYSKFLKDVEVSIGITAESPPSAVPEIPESPAPLEISLSLHYNTQTPPSPPRGPVRGGSSPLVPVNFEDSHSSPSDHATAASQENTGQSGSLSSVTSDVLKICPRFRLLVIGNSGVGKSTLIRSVFGVEDVMISNERRGQADIEREFVAKENELFVVHDTLGFEAGEGDNINTVKRFIKERRAKTDIKDRLHAVWVCLPIPYAKGRLLETGMENFLREKKDVLGDIPIVVVLTKVDLLHQLLLFEVSKNHSVKNLEDALAKVELEKTKFLDVYCAKPLQEISHGISHVAVSVEGELASTIPQLVQTTTHGIAQYIVGKAVPHGGVVARSSFESLERKAPLYLAGMAQRVSIESNVELTIDIGKKRYWRDLTATMKFSEEKVNKYLLLIHEDIIRAWNLSDTNKILQGADFKAALINASNLVVDDVARVDAQSGMKGPDPDDVIHALSAAIGSVIKASLTLPIVGATKLAKLIAQVYKAPQLRVKCFMTYITDFVYVMKILFVLSQQGPITTENVALALKVYEASTYKERIHLEIRDFNANYTIPGRDVVMEQVERMIRRYSITDDGVAELRKRIQEKE